jgi:hypothetical protein
VSVPEHTWHAVPTLTKIEDAVDIVTVGDVYDRDNGEVLFLDAK